MAGDLWSETPEQMKKGFPRCGGKPDGGEGGIRTHGPVISRFTRFRVGAVMTASILLHVQVDEIDYTMPIVSWQAYVSVP